MYEKRYVAIAVSIFAVGVAFGVAMKDWDTVYFHAVFAALASLSVVILAFSAVKKGEKLPKKFTATAFAVAALSLGVLRVSVYNHFAVSADEFNDVSDNAVLQIVEINGNSVDGKLQASEIGIPPGKKIRVYADSVSDILCVGDTVHCDLKYRYKPKMNLLADNIFMTAAGSITEYYSGSGIIYSIRKSVYESSMMLYSDFEYASEISRCVTIGDRTDMDPYIFSLYSAAGISHILAISGLHISIISMSLYNILLAFSFSRRVTGIISSMFAVFYCALVGFTPGVVRATVMLVFIMITRVFFLRGDGFTALFYALLILLMLNPYSICSASLQMSFLCSLGIMLVEPFMQKISARYLLRSREDIWYNSVLKWILSVTLGPIIISFVASVFTFPIMYSGFDSVSYISPLVNIIAVPIFTLAVELGLIAFLIAPFAASLAGLVAFPAGFCFDLVTNIAKLVYDADIGLLSVHLPFMFIPLFLSLLMIGILLFVSHKRMEKFFITAGVFCLSLVLCALYNSLISMNEVNIICNSSLESHIYLNYEDNNLYVDMGGYKSSPNVVFESGSTSLDRYVMLEYSSYSTECFKYMSDNLKISKLCLPNPQNASDMSFLSVIKQLANKRNCDIIFYNDFYSAEISDNIHIRVLGERETLVSVDVNDIKVRVLGDGYNNAVYCDIAVLNHRCETDMDKLHADVIYAQNRYAEDFANTFDECLNIKIDVKESDYNIYEP